MFLNLEISGNRNSNFISTASPFLSDERFCLFFQNKSFLFRRDCSQKVFEDKLFPGDQKNKRHIIRFQTEHTVGKLT